MKMHKAILALAVLFVAGLNAWSYEDAQTKVAAANARLGASRRKASHLDNEIQKLQDKLSSLSGSGKSAQEFSSTQATLRAKIQERNQCVSQTEDAIKQFGSEASSLGSHYVISGEAGAYSVSEPQYETLQPIETSYPQTSYQSSGYTAANRGRRW